MLDLSVPGTYSTSYLHIHTYSINSCRKTLSAIYVTLPYFKSCDPSANVLEGLCPTTQIYLCIAHPHRMGAHLCSLGCASSPTQNTKGRSSLCCRSWTPAMCSSLLDAAYASSCLPSSIKHQGQRLRASRGHRLCQGHICAHRTLLASFGLLSLTGTALSS